MSLKLTRWVTLFWYCSWCN